METIQQIKQIAEKEGITRYKIARKSGISDRLLQIYWNGDSAPSITKVEEIVKAMGYEIKIVKKEDL